MSVSTKAVLATLTVAILGGSVTGLPWITTTNKLAREEAQQ